MSIPREKRLVRLYVQLRSVTAKAGDRIDRSEITPGVILKAAQEIMKPYTITYEYCDWWTAYQVSIQTNTLLPAEQNCLRLDSASPTASASTTGSSSPETLFIPILQRWGKA